MEKEYINELVKITADNGMLLTDGDSYCTSVTTSKVNEPNWHEIPESEKPEEPTEPTIDYSHEVQSLIHERYSIDDEIALLRQKDIKPEEFKVYTDYCEECKAKVKSRM